MNYVYRSEYFYPASATKTAAYNEHRLAVGPRHQEPHDGYTQHPSLYCTSLHVRFLKLLLWRNSVSPKWSTGIRRQQRSIEMLCPRFHDFWVFSTICGCVSAITPGKQKRPSLRAAEFWAGFARDREPAPAPPAQVPEPSLPTPHLPS